jgi:hypothetical protein
MKNYLVLFLFASMILTATAQQSERAGILESLEENQQNQQNQQNQPNQQNQDQQVTATLKSASRLFGEKDDLTTVIMIIPAGSTVTVLDSDSTYFHVKYEDSEGFINKKSAILDKIQNDNNNQLNQPRYQEEDSDQPQIQESTENQPEEISRFSYLENKYGSSVAARINSGKIWKGMTPEMVTDSWGNPQKINRVINGNVIKEEWIYRNTWLYFQNNKLVEWGRKR